MSEINQLLNIINSSLELDINAKNNESVEKLRSNYNMLQSLIQHYLKISEKNQQPIQLEINNNLSKLLDLSHNIIDQSNSKKPKVILFYNKSNSSNDLITNWNSLKSSLFNIELIALNCENEKYNQIKNFFKVENNCPIVKVIVNSEIYDYDINNLNLESLTSFVSSKQ